MVRMGGWREDDVDAFARSHLRAGGLSTLDTQVMCIELRMSRGNRLGTAGSKAIEDMGPGGVGIIWTGNTRAVPGLETSVLDIWGVLAYNGK